MKSRSPIGFLTPVTVVVSLLVGIWLPLRLVFFGAMPAADAGVDVALLALAVVMHRARDVRLNPRTKWSWGFTLAIGMPAASVAILLGVGGGHYLLLAKLLLLVKLLRIRDMLDTVDSLHPVAARLLPLGVTMPMVVHVVACGWVYLGSGTAGPIDDKPLEYGKAVYWAITTLATVGYGDISAKTLPQMAYASVTMIIGVGFFGYVLSNVASLLARIDAAREHHLSVLDKLEAYMRYNQVPTGLRTDVRAYCRYLWERRRGFEEENVLHRLPMKLRGELALFLNAEIVEKVPILKGADAACVRDIVLQLRPLVAVPGEEVFVADEPGHAMYFIQQGIVEITAKTGSVIASLREGSFFGEGALLTSHPRNATARALDYTDLLVLERQAFEAVLNRHEKFARQVKEIAGQRSQAAVPPTA